MRFFIILKSVQEARQTQLLQSYRQPPQNKAHMNEYHARFVFKLEW